MKHAIPLLLACVAHAQNPELPPSGVIRAWPVFDPAIHQPGFSFTGASSSLVTGAFVPDHPGRCAVLIRGGHAYMSFQPARLDHLVGVPTPSTLAPSTQLNARQLATLTNHAGTGPDQLAAITAGGVDLWSYDGSEFVSTLSGPDAAFAGAGEIRSGFHDLGGGPENHFLTFNADWVQGGIVTGGGAILPGPRIDFPASATVWDATTVDWIPGGLPEMAILASNGMFVLDSFGSLVAAQVFSTPRGKLCAIDQGGVAALCAVLPVGGSWVARTWQPGSPTWDSPSFALSAVPNGIAAADLTGDGYSEVSVSTVDNFERIMLGTSNGPTWSGGIYIRKHTVSSTLNGTTAIFDDVDRDGELDLVMQCDGSNERYVYTGLPERFSEASGIFYAKAAVPTLPQPSIRGVVAWAGIPTGTFSETLPPGYQGLVVRFALPEGITADMQIRCYQYELQDGKVAPQAVDGWRASLPQGAESSAFDMIIPVPQGSGSSGVDCVLEFLLFDTAASVKAQAKESVFGRFLSGVGLDSESALVANQLDPAATIWLLKDYLLDPVPDANGDEVSFLFHEIWGISEIDVSTMEAPVDPDGNSSRYIGSYEPTGELEAQPDRPDGKPVPEIPSDIPL